MDSVTYIEAAISPRKADRRLWPMVGRSSRAQRKPEYHRINKKQLFLALCTDLVKCCFLLLLFFPFSCLTLHTPVAQSLRPLHWKEASQTQNLCLRQHFWYFNHPNPNLQLLSSSSMFICVVKDIIHTIQKSSLSFTGCNSSLIRL